MYNLAKTGIASNILRNVNFITFTCFQILRSQRHGFLHKTRFPCINSHPTSLPVYCLLYIVFTFPSSKKIECFLSESLDLQTKGFNLRATKSEQIRWLYVSYIQAVSKVAGFGHSQPRLVQGAKKARTSPRLILTSPKFFLTSRIFYHSFVIWIPQKTFTCLSGKLRTEFTSLIAKSTSPRLVDTTFFAHGDGSRVQS